MLTLYGGGPAFGLPDGSPFVTKTHVLLKMAGVPYTFAKANFSKAPKGKIPYIDDNGMLLGDSGFIRGHLESKYKADFDKGLSLAEKAIALAFERLCEDHLYWAIVRERWTIEANFNKGPRHFFDDAPAVMRPLIIGVMNRRVRRTLHGQGFGRHSEIEVAHLAGRDLEAISNFLGSKPWLMGQEPCAADATVWSTVTSALCPLFEGPVASAAKSHANLATYRDRGLAKWFEELRPPA